MSNKDGDPKTPKDPRAPVPMTPLSEIEVGNLKKTTTNDKDVPAPKDDIKAEDIPK